MAKFLPYLPMVLVIVWLLISMLYGLGISIMLIRAAKKDREGYNSFVKNANPKTFYAPFQEQAVRIGKEIAGVLGVRGFIAAAAYGEFIFMFTLPFRALWGLRHGLP